MLPSPNPYNCSSAEALRIRFIGNDAKDLPSAFVWPYAYSFRAPSGKGMEFVILGFHQLYVKLWYHVVEFQRNKDSHRSMGKWRCSRKNGLIVAGDELKKVAVHDKGMDPLNWKSKTHRNPSFIRQLQAEGDSILRPTNEGDKKQSIHMNSELSDRSLQVSGNAIVAENCSSLEVGPNGVVLICTERGCRPANPSETEYTTNGKDSNRIGGNRRSSGADSDGTDVYYQKMLELDPGNSLLLTNYAKFLHEVQHDVEKADKYYKRALMASPGDGEILSMYAKFIWDTRNDAGEANVYFRKAVEVASEDCYVVASYAHFIWSFQEDDDEEEEMNQA